MQDLHSVFTTTYLSDFEKYTGKLITPFADCYESRLVTGCLPTRTTSVPVSGGENELPSRIEQLLDTAFSRRFRVDS